MQDMQDMFLSKFKKLKQKNKVLFNKAMQEQSKSPKASEPTILDDYAPPSK